MASKRMIQVLCIRWESSKDNLNQARISFKSPKRLLFKLLVALNLSKLTTRI